MIMDMENSSVEYKESGKLSFQGILVSVQPRIRLLRSFDQRHHNYLGYALRIQGMIGNEERNFWVGIGKGAQAKHKFQVGCELSGEAELVENCELVTVEFYKVSKLKLLKIPAKPVNSPPPWLGVPTDLETYRSRGHRRLDGGTYEAKCLNCIWGCNMAVEMIIDQWNPGNKRYRTETFCYGPKSCSFYKAGPTRKVPGRKGMSWEEEDWVDEDAVAHRGMDE
jgi:hypothetical protein